MENKILRSHIGACQAERIINIIFSKMKKNPRLKLQLECEILGLSFLKFTRKIIETYFELTYFRFNFVSYIKQSCL